VHCLYIYIYSFSSVWPSNLPNPVAFSIQYSFALLVLLLLPLEHVAITADFNRLDPMIVFQNEISAPIIITLSISSPLAVVCF